jgi:hypothetical protein
LRHSSQKRSGDRVFSEVGGDLRSGKNGGEKSGGVERGHRFQDGVVIWKSVKRLDKEVAITFFDMEKANRSIGDSSARLKNVEKFVFAIASLQLGLNHPEKVWGNGFAFAFGRVANGRLSIDRLVVFTSDS